MAELMACTANNVKKINPWTGETFTFEPGVFYREIYNTGNGCSC